MNTIDPITEEVIKNVINGKDEEIKRLTRQNKALKKWIKTTLKINIDIDEVVYEIDRLFPDEEEQIMTPSEMEQHMRKIEMYSDVFSYGRIEEKKMAESL